MGKRIAKAALIAGGAIASLAGSAIAGTATFTNRVRRSCSKFYDMAEVAFREPGINRGFVPQDITYSEELGSWLICGYMANGSRSPFYVRSASGKTKRLTVRHPNGTDYKGHGAAIAVNGKHTYLTTKTGCMVLSTDDIVKAKSGACITAGTEVNLMLEPAFMFVNGDTLYVGEFYHKKAYETPQSHRLPAPDGVLNPAMMYAFKLDGSTSTGISTDPCAAYSIPAEVQGVCITNDMHMVLSMSWALQDSKVSAYDMSKFEQRGTFRAGNDASVPLYFLYEDNLAYTLPSPPMMEGLCFHDGAIWIANESASTKYKFGHLLHAGVIYKLPWPFWVKL